MTKSLVHQLQAEAVDDSSSISGLLIKAKLVASKLGLEDLTEWIDCELGGYPSRSSVPSYRQFSCHPEVFNPYLGWTPINFGASTEEPLHELTTLYIHESISSIERHVADSSNLKFGMHDVLSEMLHAACDSSSKFEIAWRISAATMSSILTTVRSKILTWSLDLEKQGVLGEGVNFSLREREIADMVFKNDFNGAVINNNGVLGSSTGSIVQENTMSVGSLDLLRDELKKIGVSDDEVEELQEAIKASAPPLQIVDSAQKSQNGLVKFPSKQCREA